MNEIKKFPKFKIDRFRGIDALFLEYVAVLGRKQTRTATGNTLKNVAEAMSAIAAIAEGVDNSLRARPMLSDAADEMVLETALNGNADAIVTHNVRGFRPALTMGVTVSTPADIIRKSKK